MISSSNNARRCRPLLGTFVEISADREASLDSAFAAVERVHRLMSFHDDASDVSRLNREAVRHAVRVDEWTYHVLREARKISQRSEGRFDITVAPILQRWKLLPGKSEPSPLASYSDIQLLPNCRVRFRRPLKIDLGGIAKGFAVDRAVETLLAAGATYGTVNAGGDLRFFGNQPQPVHVRHPASPGNLLMLGHFKNCAVATSATYFSRALVNPRTRRACSTTASVSVCASSCLVADALTKVVAIMGRRSVDIIREFAASVSLLYPDGRCYTCG